MKRRFVLAVAGAACLLAACGKKDDAAKANAPAAGSVPVSLEKIATEGKGFNVGSTMSARVVYVFFDAQCPHCAALWESAKPLKAQARFVWIPVSLLNANSAPQGGTILAAADPVATMDQHEALLREKQGGIPAAAGVDEKRKAVDANTALFNKLGLNAVPGIFAKNAVTGEFVSIEGALPTAGLAQK